MPDTSRDLQSREHVAGGHWHIIAAILVIGAFFLGGSSRAEVSSLAALRPAAVIIIGLVLITVRTADFQRFSALVLVAVVSLLLCTIQIIPLPAGVASALAGHDILSEVDRTVGLGSVWRPISMVPGATWNAFWALLVPLALMVLILKSPDNSATYLLPAIFCMGLVTALMSIAQILGDPQSVMYFYEVTNNGFAVGLFANRNHQAVFLAALLPLIFAYAKLPHKVRKPSRVGGIMKYDPRLVLAVAAAAVIIPLILISGSRSGLLALVIALFGVALLLLKAGHGAGVFGTSPRLQTFVVVFGMIALFILSLWLDRGLAVDRLIDIQATDDLRYAILPAMQDMVANYAPWGSGFGSFDKVYRAAEPTALLIPQYMNQAHNDWLDIILTGGILAICVALFACVTWVRRTFKVFSAPEPDALQPLRKASLVVLLILAVASASDYPLRTPALACFFVLVIFWAALPLNVSGPRSAQKGQLIP